MVGKEIFLSEEMIVEVSSQENSVDIVDVEILPERQSALMDF
jgi:hypothetical protein